MQTVTAIEVTYWAVQGDRWCNVDGMIDAERVKQWEASGWRMVTRVTQREAEVFGEIETTSDVLVNHGWSIEVLEVGKL